MTANSHPARSPEFLSRLHDGELSPAERAQFESHRAHCVECRNSAAEFEAALSLYRSSIPAPAAPDLAARILRRLQAKGSRRQRFGPTFGIDLRWAGAFAVAVIAAIVGSTIVARNESRQREAARLASVPVSLEQAPAPAAPAPPASEARGDIGGLSVPASPRSRSDAEAARREESAIERDKEKEKKASSGLDGRRTNPQNAEFLDEKPSEDRPANSPESTESDAGQQAQTSVAAAPPAAQNQTQRPHQDVMKAAGAMRSEAPAPGRRQDAFVAQQAASQAAPQAAHQPAQRELDPAGGEGAAAVDQVRPPAAAPVRLVVSPLDGLSSTPGLVEESAADVPATLRGQNFIVMVDASGRVRSVSPWRKPVASHSATRPPPQTQTQTQTQAARAKDAESPLQALRFQPGDAPRRLLVRVE